MEKKSYNYDDSSPYSIEKYAKKIENKTLWQVSEVEGIYINKKNKGRLGHLIEKEYFGYKINSDKSADFKEAGVELKVCPLKKIKKRPNDERISKRKGLSVKERMVLTLIDYMEVHKETWENNTLFEKIDLLLLMFYIYEKGQLAINSVFELVSLWQPSEEDLKIIKQDWELIINKIYEGKAHEISEGDTMYLGACTKGSSAKSVREQPFSIEPAKQRAFSFKRSYVDAIFEELLSKKKAKVALMKDKEKDIDTVLTDIFSPFIGKCAYEIEKELGLEFNKIPKQYYALLANKIMGSDEERHIEEFDKAGIKVKSIRLKTNGIPKEHISFPAFEFIEIVDRSWESSDFRAILEESKFFFVIYRINTTTLTQYNKLSRRERTKHTVLEKVMLWNMPEKDIEGGARDVWERTVEIIKQGGPEVTWKGNRQFNNFPKSSDSKVAHVRPHGRNRDDTFPLPNGGEFTKQSFWLNKRYIKYQIENYL